MNTEKLFSTKERVAILQHVIFSETEFGVNEVAKRLLVSKGLVSKYLDILVTENILERKNTKFIVRNTKEVKSLKIIFNIQDIDTDIFKRYKFVEAAGLYGSCAKGINTNSSDADLWIKINKTDNDKLAKLTSELRKNIKNVKILILDDNKLETLKKEDPLFYHSLYFGSVTVYGEENAI